MFTKGKITRETDDLVLVEVPKLNDWVLEKRQIKTVGVYFDDGRHMSTDQRKKIFALVNDIAAWQADDPEAIRALLTGLFCEYTQGTSFPVDYFSLSPKSPKYADMTTAKWFIEYIIHFCIHWDVPTRRPLFEYTSEQGRLMYSFVLMRKCAIGGKLGAEIHHVDAVGMGYNRNEIIHVGMRVLPLLHEYHQEAHTIGRERFLEKYHLTPIKIDEYAAERLKLGKRPEKVEE